MPRTCAVRLLGGFEVTVDGHPVAVEEWRHRRGADLVKLLALAPQNKLHRDQVMQYLWPELGAEAAAANLRKAVHFARRGLGVMEAIETSGDMLALWPEEPLVIDAKQFEAEANRALAHESAYELVLPLYTGELLPEDRYAEWTEPHRERLQQRYLQLLRKLGRWEDVLRIDRSDEVACRALMRAYLEAGDRGAAIRQFQRLRDVLHVDLGVAPEPETVKLFEQAIAVQSGAAPAASEAAQALLARGLVQWNEQDLAAAQESAEAARELALEQHLDRELGEASALLGMVAMAGGRWPDVFRSQFARALEHSTDRAPVVLEAHLCLAEASLAGGDSRAVGALARELLDQAVAAGSVDGEALMSLFIGEAEFFAGRLTAADEWLTRAAQLYTRKSGSGLAFTLLRRAELAAIVQGPAHAMPLLNEAKHAAQPAQLASHLRTRVLEVAIKTTADLTRKEAIVGEAETYMARPKEVCRPCSIGLSVAAAICCARNEELARSRYWLGQAEKLAGMWSGGPFQAAVWEARAALRAAEGDRAQADALLREASELYAQFGRPLDEARCRSAIAVA